MKARATKVPVAILVRVSTVKQETDCQISELQAYAESKGYEVLEICREVISGRADEDDRHGLKRAKELAVSGKVKKVLVHEIPRLARKNSVAHKFIETLEEHGVSFTGTPRESRRFYHQGKGILPLVSCSRYSRKWRGTKWIF